MRAVTQFPCAHLPSSRACTYPVLGSRARTYLMRVQLLNFHARSYSIPVRTVLGSRARTYLMRVHMLYECAPKIKKLQNVRTIH